MTVRDHQGLESRYDSDTEILTIIIDRKIIEHTVSMDKLRDMLKERIGQADVSSVMIVPRKGT